MEIKVDADDADLFRSFFLCLIPVFQYIDYASFLDIVFPQQRGQRQGRRDGSRLVDVRWRLESLMHN